MTYKAIVPTYMQGRDTRYDRRNKADLETARTGNALQPTNRSISIEEKPYYLKMFEHDLYPKTH